MRNLKSPILLYLVSWLSMTIQLTSFLCSLSITTRNLLWILFLSAADCSLILLPYFFLPRKWRWSITLPSVLLGVWSLINICYFRYFGDLTPVSNMMDTAGLNSFVIRSGAEALSVRELWQLFGLIPVAVAVIWRKRISGGAFGWRWRLGAVGATLILIAGQQSFYYFLITHKRESIGKFLIDPKRISRIDFYVENGLWKYLTVGSLFDLKHYPPLTSEEEQEWKDFITDRQKELEEFQRSEAGIALQPVIERNRKKNIILLIVESLSDNMLIPLAEDESGREIVAMPWLRSVMTDSTAIFTTGVTDVSNNGGSSDGQFVYNTGLFPLRHEALVARYADVPYPGLPKALGRVSAEFIAENKSVWYHGITSQSYGYDRLYSSIIDDDHVKGRDKILIDKMLDSEIWKSGKPVFAEVTTIDMHMPYTLADTSEAAVLAHRNLLRRKGYTDQDIAYIEVSAATDKAMEYMVRRLQQTGRYANTMIVIASDHTPFKNALGKTHNDSIVMAFLNAGVTLKRNGGVSQPDLYPTLLHLTGADFRWPGQGRSLLLPTPSDADADTVNAPDNNDRRLAERVIRSRYFASPVLSDYFQKEEIRTIKMREGQTHFTRKSIIP